MPAAVSRYRASLLAVSAALFSLIFSFFLILEKLWLGIGDFYYFPVAMIALARKLPYGDQLARIGGDEFALITSTPGTDAVRALCGRLTAALAEEGLSMSFGWAVCPRDGDSSLLLYRAADERLYAQKLIRNRLSEGEVVGLPSQAERLMLRARRGA